MIRFPRSRNLTVDYTLPIQPVGGTFCTDVQFRVAQGKIVIFANVGVQSYKVHIVDHLPFLDSVILFSSFGATSIKGISNIYKRILYTGARAIFISKARIFAQRVPNVTLPDRDNLITSVYDFL